MYRTLQLLVLLVFIIKAGSQISNSFRDVSTVLSETLTIYMYMSRDCERLSVFYQSENSP